MICYVGVCSLLYNNNFIIEFYISKDDRIVFICGL